VIGPDAMWTYDHLIRFSQTVACRLTETGVRHEDVVGICVGRRPELVGTMLGVLDAGAAYAPLDRTYPTQRLRTMLAACRAGLVVVDGESEPAIAAAFDGPRIRVEDLAPAGAPPAAAATCRPPGRLAYVLFTSGSTGQPKGVAVELRHLERYVAGVTAVLRPEPRDAFALVQPVTFGSCLTMLFPSLVSGGVLHLVDRATALDPNRYGDYSERRAIAGPLRSGSTWRTAKPASATRRRTWSLQSPARSGPSTSTGARPRAASNEGTRSSARRARGSSRSTAMTAGIYPIGRRASTPGQGVANTVICSWVRRQSVLVPVGWTSSK